ncbi:unnamed protein product, partial [Cladocopium goreaui]
VLEVVGATGSTMVSYILNCLFCFLALQHQCMSEVRHPQLLLQLVFLVLWLKVHPETIWTQAQMIEDSEELPPLEREGSDPSGYFAGSLLTFRNSVRTAILAFDTSMEGHLGPWLSKAFVARGSDSLELARDSGNFPRRVIDRYQELPAFRTFDFLWEGVETALRASAPVPKAKAAAAMVAFLGGLGPVVGLTSTLDPTSTGFLDFIGDTGAGEAPEILSALKRLGFDSDLNPQPFDPKGEPALFLGAELNGGMKFKGLYRVLPLAAFKEGSMRERAVRTLAIPPGPWQFPAKVEGKDSLKLDPMPGYLGDFRDEKGDEKDEHANWEKELAQFHKEMEEMAENKGDDISPARTAGGTKAHSETNLKGKAEASKEVGARSLGVWDESRAIEVDELMNRYLGRDHLIFELGKGKTVFMAMTDYAKSAYEMYEHEFGVLIEFSAFGIMRRAAASISIACLRCGR